MNETVNPTYNFIISEFDYNGVHYKVVLCPELYPEEDGIDFTGNYQGMLINFSRGTKTFELLVDAHTKWQTVPKGMDPGLLDELDKLIELARGKKTETITSSISNQSPG